MIVVADVSVLVGELLRRRGRELLLRPNLHVVVAEDQWEETEHELSRRLGILESQGRFTLNGSEPSRKSGSAYCSIRCSNLSESSPSEPPTTPIDTGNPTVPDPLPAIS